MDSQVFASELCIRVFHMIYIESSNFHILHFASNWIGHRRNASSDLYVFVRNHEIDHLAILFINEWRKRRAKNGIRKAVMVGEKGSGKTALMKKVALFPFHFNDLDCCSTSVRFD